MCSNNLTIKNIYLRIQKAMLQPLENAQVRRQREFLIEEMKIYFMQSCDMNDIMQEKGTHSRI